MSKKDYKRKRSKALTKQRKQVKDPEIEKTIGQINTKSSVANPHKKN